MGIYIPNMEMPKTCCQCDLKIYDPEKRWNENGIEQIGAWVCKRTGEVIWNTQRGEDCPLDPLPEGHGDLMDKAAFETDIKNRYCTGCDNYKGLKCKACWVDDMLGEVEDAPTIVPAEGGNKE